MKSKSKGLKKKKKKTQSLITTFIDPNCFIQYYIAWLNSMMCFGEHITYLLYLLAICMWLEIATRQGRIKVNQDGWRYGGFNNDKIKMREKRTSMFESSERKGENNKNGS